MRLRTWLLWMIPIVVLSGTAGLAARRGSRHPQAPPSPTTTLRSRSELVVLHVFVEPDHAPANARLTDADFLVSEDGRPQAIAFFSHDDVPITVGLIVDTSSSLSARRTDVVAAGRAFAHASHEDDEMFTIDFDDVPRLGLAAGQDFTSDINVLTRALESIHGRGRTALFDAVMLGLDHLGRASNDSTYLIVLSDGADNASRTTLDEVLGAASRSNVVIYTVGLFTPDDRERNPGALKRLARATGGQAVFPRSGEQLSTAMETIARQIRDGYTLSYVPAETARDGKYHSISVELVPRLRHSFKLRTRRGYVAALESESAQ